MRGREFAFVYVSLCREVPRLRCSETKVIGQRGPWVKATTRTPRLKTWFVNLESGQVVSEGAIREARLNEYGGQNES